MGRDTDDVALVCLGHGGGGGGGGNDSIDSRCAASAASGWSSSAVAYAPGSPFIACKKWAPVACVICRSVLSVYIVVVK